MKARGLVLSTLLTLSGVFLLPSVSFAQAVIDTITGNSNVSPLISNESYNTGSEYVTGFVILPDQPYDVRSLIVEMCRSTNVVTNNIRAQLWLWDYGDTPEFTLIAYSDWVDTSTFRNRLGGACDQPEDRIVFDFGTRSTLSAGNTYILTFNFQTPLTSNSSSSISIQRKATTTSITPDTVIDWARFNADTDNSPWRLDSFDFYLDYIPSLLTSPNRLSDYEVGESYIDIQEVLVHDGATTTSYTCSHSSDLSEYYGHCFIVGSSTKDFDSIQVVGSYTIPAYDYYFIEGWLKTAPTSNGSTRPIGDSQTWLTTTETGTYTFSWIIPPDTPAVSQFLLSNSAQTYVEDYTGATAQVYVGFCETQEECENNFWAFTTTGDGISVTNTDNLCWNQYSCTFGDIGCFLTKMFKPCAANLQTVIGNATTTLSESWPLGYFYREWDSFMSATPTDFVISLDVSRFDSGTGIGLTNLTASGTPVGQINISEAARQAHLLIDPTGTNDSDFIDIVENFIFAFWWLFFAWRIAFGLYPALTDTYGTGYRQEVMYHNYWVNQANRQAGSDAYRERTKALSQLGRKR